MLAAKVNIAISREVGIAGSPRSATRIHAVAGTRLPSLRALFILEHCFILIFSSWLCSRTALALFAQNRQPGCTKSSRKPRIAPIDSDGKLSRSDVLHRDLPDPSRNIDLVAGRFTRDCLPGGGRDRCRIELPHRGLPPGARVPFVEIKRRQIADRRPTFSDT